jgi:hypothetical protein
MVLGHWTTALSRPSAGLAIRKSHLLLSTTMMPLVIFFAFVATSGVFGDTCMLLNVAQKCNAGKRYTGFAMSAACHAYIALFADRGPSLNVNATRE